MSKTSLKDLLQDPSLRKQFMSDAGISARLLEELLDEGDAETLVSYLETPEVFQYSTEQGSCEVFSWKGYFFSKSEWDDFAGPFNSLDEALEPIRYLLECGDECETDSATHWVESKLTDQQTFSVIKKLVSVGDVVEVNGVKYRRKKNGYSKE
jgi:hypothetical protein